MQAVRNLVGYTRISVDEELDSENTSIENQKSIIADFVEKRFPGCLLEFYEDRDRSGYTFEQREGYQKMRKKLMKSEYDILVVKDFSRFARRNSRGLVELEDLRDAGVRIISIGDSIDYPKNDDWTAIQFRFLINEMPVTDTSKKVKSVIQRCQNEGKWVCSVPYGYSFINSKNMTYAINEVEANIVRKVFELYNSGYGYKKIANYLTEQHIPTPRMSEKMRREAAGEEYRFKTRPEWSVVTIQAILSNDFYIGTLRQNKFYRKKINGVDVRREDNEHIVFENHHDPVIDYRTFGLTQELLKKRSTSHYRGIKKYDNVYSGFLFCGDCGCPMFSMSRPDLAPAYTCGAYHRRGRIACSSHHTRVDVLDKLLKSYIHKVRDNSSDMIAELNKSIVNEKIDATKCRSAVDEIQNQIVLAKEEMKTLTRQKVLEIMRRPSNEDLINSTYAGLLDEVSERIQGLENQLLMVTDKQNAVTRINRKAKTALDTFDDLLRKEKLDKTDLALVLEKIEVFEDHLEIKLKPDFTTLLAVEKNGVVACSKQIIVQSARNQRDKVFNINVINSGDPLEIFTDREGEVILKKYSPIGELGDFSKEYVESLHQSLGHIACICDKDTIIAVSGAGKRELIDKSIAEELELIMKNREKIQASKVDGGKFYQITTDDDENNSFTAETIVPILSEGDIIGAVVLLSKEPNARMADMEMKVAETAAGFVGKQMEQ